MADDGSGPATGQLVDRLARDVSYPLSRVWQPHDGFRLAAIRNLAIRGARGAVLVLSDGDCVPSPSTLEAHADRCRPGEALTGGRCLLTEEETREVLQGFPGREARFEKALARELPGLRRLVRRNRLYRATRLKARPKLLTANASVHREDIWRVNGLDERFVGWGYEDEDLARRLRRAGARIQDGTLESVVLHLFHPVHPSHRPDARGTANYRHFKTGRFLLRPLRGLVARPPRELEIEILGARPPWLEASHPSTRGTRPDVSLVFGRGGALRRPRGEVVFTGLSPESFRSFPDVERFLEERL